MTSFNFNRSNRTRHLLVLGLSIVVFAVLGNFVESINLVARVDEDSKLFSNIKTGDNIGRIRGSRVRRALSSDDDEGKGAKGSKGSKNGDDDDDDRGTKGGKGSKSGKGSKKSYYGDDDDDGKGSKSGKTSKSAKGSKGGKASKSAKGSKSYFNGDDDDDDDGKGSKRKKGSKTSKSRSKKSHSSTTESRIDVESSSVDKPKNSMTSQEKDHKEHIADIGEQGRGIFAGMRPDLWGELNEEDQSDKIVVDTTQSQQQDLSPKEDSNSAANDRIVESTQSQSQHSKEDIGGTGEVTIEDTSQSQKQILEDDIDGTSETTVVETTHSQSPNEDIGVADAVTDMDTTHSKDNILEDDIGDNSATAVVDATQSQGLKEEIGGTVEENAEDTTHSKEQILEDDIEGNSQTSIVDIIQSKEENISPEENIPEGTGDTIDADTAPLEEEKNIRTVQLFHPEALDECVTYDKELEEMTIFMSECSTLNNDTRHDDYWEILQARVSINNTEGNTFHLRHKATQLCIPMNTENPDASFNCQRYFGMNEAIADSFNGLIDCDSGVAAVFGMGGVSNSLYLKNAGCSDMAISDNKSDLDIVFITYQNPVEEKRVVVLGQSILLELGGAVASYDFRTEWAFLDVKDIDREKKVVAPQPHSDLFDHIFHLNDGKSKNGSSPAKRT
ncbi:unnamed protein product [Pseudo-nitzschia multistriata]|uniref:Uncharacterized protein n=1 Tax=Pseudo-nitzschia multistriata TaxID=183589 RepID=A0A448Z127_9STRA|nr:unnamed protein product [Pseudo-nitzschia multistriata]